MGRRESGQTYKDAGVDFDAADAAKQRIKALAATTHGPQVLGGVGGFGGLFELSGYRQPVLVSGTDNVGTKLKIALAMRQFENLGRDVVNACVNDVIVCGAKPLFFLDYIATGMMDAGLAEEIVRGIVAACIENGCALIGGETSELPGLFAQGEFDLSGFAVGVVEKNNILDGSNIREGDVLIGIPSNGLHTNGFSLVRHSSGTRRRPIAALRAPRRDRRHHWTGAAATAYGVLPDRASNAQSPEGHGARNGRRPSRQRAANAAGRAGRTLRPFNLDRSADFHPAAGTQQYRLRRDVPRIQHGFGDGARVRRRERRAGLLSGAGGTRRGRGRSSDRRQKSQPVEWRLKFYSQIPAP